MAKGRRRPRGVYVKGGIEEQLDLSTLAANTVIETPFDNTSPETCFVSSIVVTLQIDDLTEPQGPIWVGVSHSDYSAAEIQEALLTAGSWDRGNKIAQEQAKRLVRKLGVLGGAGSATPGDVVAWDGASKKFKLNWLLAPGDGLNLWAMNVGQSALATTDPRVTLLGHANLWMR